MKKSLILLSAIAMFGLVACGGNPEGSKSTGDNSGNVTPTSSETKSSEAPVEVPSIYEHQFVYLSPGKAYDSETKTEGEENTLVEQVFSNGKHGGPNYMVAINLLKEDNKCEIARYTMYYSGICVGKAAFSVEGATWAKNTDGTEEMFWFAKGTFAIPEQQDKTEDDSTDTNGMSLTYSAVKTTHLFNGKPCKNRNGLKMRTR